MMKKLLCVLLVLIMVLSCFAGCTQTSDPNAGATEPPVSNNADDAVQQGDDNAAEPADKLKEDAGKTITIAHNQGEYIYPALHEIGDKFEELTGIKVEWQEIPSSDWDTWCTAQFAAGTEPDIVWSLANKGDYFDQGKLMDLTPYYDQENVFNGKIWKDCFTEGGLDACYSNDGTKLIGTAITYATVNLYYNKDAMQALGLGDSAPTSYTEMFEMMEVAKNDGTYIPMSVMNSMNWNLGWIEDDITDALFSDTDILQKLDIIVPNGWLDESEILLGLKTGVLQYDDPRYQTISARA